MVIKERIEHNTELAEELFQSRSWLDPQLMQRAENHLVCQVGSKPSLFFDFNTDPKFLANAVRQIRLLVVPNPVLPSSKGHSGFRVCATNASAAPEELACWFFVLQAQLVPIVKELRCVEDEDGVTVWVITEGPRMDFDSNKPIYEAALKTMRFVGKPIFDFRIVNVNEIEGGSVEDIVPTEAKSHWKRQDANKD
jgi:hypothetical protein